MNTAIDKIIDLMKSVKSCLPKEAESTGFVVQRLIENAIKFRNTQGETIDSGFEMWLSGAVRTAKSNSKMTAYSDVLVRYREFKKMAKGNKEIPLAVLADRKGITIYGKKGRAALTFVDQWELYCMETDKSPGVIATSREYDKAEAKAREYLNGLPDKEDKI